MQNTTSSVDETSTSGFVAAGHSDDAGDLRAEMVDDLCSLALMLSGHTRCKMFDDLAFCRLCLVDEVDGSIEHRDTCAVSQTHKVVAAIKREREEARLVARRLAERHIEYDAALVDPVLGELVEAEFTPGMLSHAEAAVLHAAGVPPELRGAIYAEAVAKQAADDAAAAGVAR